MNGRKVKEGVRFCVFTNIGAVCHGGAVPHHSGSEGLGCRGSDQRLHPAYHQRGQGCKSIGLSSFKLCNGSKDERDCPIYYGSDEQVIDAAISGYWEVKRRYE